MINEEQLPKIILQISLVLLFLISASSYLFVSASAGSGFFAGASIAILNFIWQRRSLTNTLLHSGSVGSATFRYLIRFAITGLALYLIITSGKVSIFALLAGLSVIVAVIVMLTVYQLFHQNKGD